MSKPTDEQLRQAIDAIFNKYDADQSGTLEDNEIFALINDAFKSLGRNKQVSHQEVRQFIQAIDKNGDGKIAKPELFEILKKLINGWSWLHLSFFTYFSSVPLFHSYRILLDSYLQLCKPKIIKSNLEGY